MGAILILAYRRMCRLLGGPVVVYVLVLRKFCGLGQVPWRIFDEGGRVMRLDHGIWGSA